MKKLLLTGVPLALLTAQVIRLQLVAEEPEPSASRTVQSTTGATPAGPGPEDVKDFEKQYALAGSEVLKRVGPPYIAGRLDLYRKTASREQQQAIPEGPGTKIYLWEDDKLQLRSSLFGNDG